ASRRRVRARLHAAALRDARGPGARARDPAVQARRALGDERRDGPALRDRLMSEAAIDANARPAIGRGFRLQWEPAQAAHVLLYPEGMVKLNSSAGEILKRCD